MEEVPGMVAFVYKDGLFTGEDQRGGGLNVRLGEANDPELGLDAGRQLASFQPGMQSVRSCGAPSRSGSDTAGVPEPHEL